MKPEPLNEQKELAKVIEDTQLQAWLHTLSSKERHEIERIEDGTWEIDLNE